MKRLRSPPRYGRSTDPGLNRFVRINEIVFKFITLLVAVYFAAQLIWSMIS
jgi:hypothetical protein